MSVHAGPDIVEDGLIFAVDAGNTRSYPGTGTTFFDLSKTKNKIANNSASFTNVDEYNFNGDIIDVNGVDEHIQFPNISTSTNSFSVECWAYWDDVGANSGAARVPFGFGAFFRFYLNSDNRLTFWVRETGQGVNTAVTDANDTVQEQKWIHMIGTCQGGVGGSIKIYRNGEFRNSNNISFNVDTGNGTNNLFIGNAYNGATSYFDGKVAIARIYDKVLTPSEVLQNYHAVKNRVLNSNLTTSAPAGTLTENISGTTLSAAGQAVTINYTGNMGTFTVANSIVVDIDAYGGAGGRGMWSSNNDPGGPGGRVVGRYTLNAGTYYYFVGEGNKSVSGKAGAGGGSTDVRTSYPGGTTFSITDFMDNTSLNSRFIVAGGGGGAHGGTYGYWGYSGTNSPGAGGPTTTNTNSRGSNDQGHVATGASTSAGGSDGGSSQDTVRYTNNGTFGRGGIPTSPLQTLTYSSTTNYSGLGWPNGGSGTTWANGGGGGGYYGGASNWPNGGGGSNYIASGSGATLTSILGNVGEVQTGNGSLTITVVSV